MNRKAQASMEFILEYGRAILASIVVIAVLAIGFKPSSILTGENSTTFDNIRCTGEKLCEKFESSNFSYYKDSFTDSKAITIYCERKLNDYTTEQFVFTVSDKNKFNAIGCENATR